MSRQIFDFLAARSSTPIVAIGEPAPSADDLRDILRVASRVPDHGKLAPWRFIIYRGDARHQVGEYLVRRAEEREGPLTDARKEQERTRFSRAPLVVGVIFSPVASEKIPQWEQLLSSGAAAMNLCLAANALGYATNWITNWYADDEQARALLGLAPHERVTGFIHIGTSTLKAPDRPRPDLDAIVSDYKGPYQLYAKNQKITINSCNKYVL